MVMRQSSERWIANLFFCLTAFLMLSLPLSSLAAAEDAIITAAQSMAAEPFTGKADDSVAAITLVKEEKEKHQKSDCPAIEVDEDGKPVHPNEKKGVMVPHWPCQKVANGLGGYKCNALTNGKLGCNDCPTCKCTNVGTGASQNCLCQ